MAKAMVLWLLRRSRRELAVAGGAAAGLLIVVAAVAVGVGHPSHHSSAPTHHAAPALAFAPPQHDDIGSSIDQPPTTAAPGAPTLPAHAGRLRPPSSPQPPTCGPADLRGGVSTNQSSYIGGQPVVITVTIRNASAHPCSSPFYCSSSKFTISGPGGWHADSMNVAIECMMVEGWQPPVLAPGDSVADYAVWNQTGPYFCTGCGPGFQTAYAPSGNYTVEAEWNGVDAASTPFEIKVPPCDASDVALALSADRFQYTAGELVHLTATVVQRPSSRPWIATTCSVFRGGSSSPSFTASNGPVQVWQGCSADCPPGDFVVLGPGITVQARATWDQTTCAEGTSTCTRTRAPSGTYQITAGWPFLGGVSQSIELK